MRKSALILGWLLMLASVGCSKPSNQANDAEASSNLLGSKSVALPAGTVITVRLGQALGSKTSSNGDSFTASVAEPVEIGGKTVVPAGATATGHVVEAVPEGRFKGGAVLRITVDSLTVGGSKYDLQTKSVSHGLKGKGRRTAVMVGGGAGAGALIGGLAGGGKGALIGAALGAGAGTAGAAYTGNKNIVLPAESAVSFKLTAPITINN
jgi:hypothetical protein